jgi:hypothetical protein
VTTPVDPAYIGFVSPLMDRVMNSDSLPQHAVTAATHLKSILPAEE